MAWYRQHALSSAAGLHSREGKIRHSDGTPLLRILQKHLSVSASPATDCPISGSGLRPVHSPASTECHRRPEVTAEQTRNTVFLFCVPARGVRSSPQEGLKARGARGQRVQNYVQSPSCDLQLHTNTEHRVWKPKWQNCSNTRESSTCSAESGTWTCFRRSKNRVMRWRGIHVNGRASGLTIFMQIRVSTPPGTGATASLWGVTGKGPGAGIQLTPPLSPPPQEPTHSEPGPPLLEHSSSTWRSQETFCEDGQGRVENKGQTQHRFILFGHRAVAPGA